VGLGADDDDPGRFGLQKQWEEEVGEIEVAKVVHGKVFF